MMRNRDLNRKSTRPSSPASLSDRNESAYHPVGIKPACSSIPGRRKKFSVRVLMSLMAMLVAPASTLAGPLGEQVSAGTATITRPDAITTVIDQQTQRTVVDWQSFGVGETEKVIFQQPGTSSISLNRVHGSDPSYIYGSLTSNGQVFLVNPHGVLFGPTSRVDVHGLLATTLDISNSEFMAGGNTFTAVAGANGQVNNEGVLTADPGGYIVLAGDRADNSGVIEARLGRVALAAGSKITLDLAGDQLISLGVDEATLASAAGVTNVGDLLADGGRVLMTARTAMDIASTVVNNQGLVQARTIQEQHGEIMLAGDMGHGTVEVGGTLDASGLDGADGGFIETSGQRVAVADGATITAAAGEGRMVGSWRLSDGTDFFIEPTGAPPNVGGGMTGETLSNALATTNVMIDRVGGPALLPTADKGDIVINDSVTWATGTRFRANAINDVVVDAPVTNTGVGGIDLRADADADSVGTVRFNAGPTDNGSLTSGGKVLIFSNAYNQATGYADANPNLYSEYFTDNGTGALAYYMLVNDVDQLQAINTNLLGSYTLGRDINAGATQGWNGGAGFTPLGNWDSVFGGSFAGEGHTIQNLTINLPENTSPTGLFGVISGGEIRDVGLIDANITGSGSVGGLVGENYGSVSRAYVTGSVAGTGTFVGGLVGGNAGSVSDSYTAGTVTGLNLAVGGLIGGNVGAVSNSYSTSSVEGTSFVGGLVGVNSSYSASGFNGLGLIDGAYSTGAVTGAGDGVGGLIGYNMSGDLRYSYSTSSVQGGNYVGGLIGYNNGTLLGAPLGTPPDGTGTIAGPATVADVYSAGSVIGSTYVGGLIGFDESGGEFVTSSFWNMDTSGQTASAGGAGAVGLTTVQMKQKGSFLNSGWDFDTVWGIDEGASYPYLFANQQMLHPGASLGIYWDGGAGDWLWTSSLNWSTDVLPGIGDNVKIDVVGGTVLLTSGDQAINSLICDADFELAGGSLTIANSAMFNAYLNLIDGMLSLNGVSSIKDYSQTYGRLQGSGTLAITNSFSNTGGSIDGSFAGLFITQAYGNLSIGAPITIAGALSLKVSDGATVSQLAPITAGGLELLGIGGSYYLTDMNNRIGILAGDVAYAELVDNQTLTIGTVNSSRILKASGDINLIATRLSEQESGIVVNSPLVSTGGNIALLTENGIVMNAAELKAMGNISLTANANGGSGDFIQNAGLISNSDTTTPGDITISANDITVGAVSSKRDVHLNSGYNVTILGQGQDVFADDTFFAYSLPFGFSYYGQSYDTMYISTNGVITFDGGTREFQNSGAALIDGIPKAFYASTDEAGGGLKVISPAWNDWDTRYYGNIYIDRPSLSAVSVKWDVSEYENPSRTNKIEAVLNQEGDILFNYGAQIGEGGTPTIGLSKGDGAHYTLSSLNGTANLNNLSSLLYNYDAATDNYVETIGIPGGFGDTSVIGEGIGNITAAVGSTISSGIGGIIELHATGNFDNQAGSSLFVPGEGGRWLVWSTDPSLDNRNGILYDFKQYDALFGGTPVQGSGNGFLYTVAPLLTPYLTGTVTKVYDGTTSATLSDENFTVVGAIDGDTVNLNSSTLGSYDTKDAATGKAVTVIGLDFTASNNSAAVFGYSLSSTTLSGDIGTITRRPVNVMADEQTKVYGDTDPSLTFQAETMGVNRGLVSGESLMGSLTRVAGETVMAGPYAIQQGTLTNESNINYDINYAYANLTITPRPLTLMPPMVADKVYDGTTAVTGLETWTPDGLIGTDAVSVNFSAAFYDYKDVGERIVTINGVALSGPDAGNYSIGDQTTLTAPAEITPLTVTGSITAANKVYDGSTLATILSRTLSGVIPEDVVSYTGGTATFSDKNAADGKTVTGTGLGLSGVDAGNYLVNTTATTTADITPANDTSATVEEVKALVAAITADIIAATQPVNPGTLAAQSSGAAMSGTEVAANGVEAATKGEEAASGEGTSSEEDKNKDKVAVDQSSQNQDLRQQPLFTLDAGAVAGQNMVCK